MAEPRDDRTPPRYEDTNRPEHAPNALIEPRARNRIFWSYFGPILVLLVVAALGLVYWARHNPSANHAPSETTIGTTGDAGSAPGYEPGSTPGGHDPQDVLRPGSTNEELHRRGADGRSEGPNPALYEHNAPLTGLDAVLQKPSVVAGRSVDVRDVTVDSAQGNRFWVRSSDMKVEVLAPDGTAVKAGMHVRVIGTVEDDGTGRSRIRASRVEVKK